MLTKPKFLTLAFMVCCTGCAQRHTDGEKAVQTINLPSSTKPTAPVEFQLHTLYEPEQIVAQSLAKNTINSKMKVKLLNVKVVKDKAVSKLPNLPLPSVKHQFFDIEVSNLVQSPKTVYIVVYATNDRFSPPRRGAWPVGGLLFYQAGTQRANLSHYDISRNWESRPEETKGFKVVLPAGGRHKIECALPINNVCQHEAWRGQRIDPRANYEDWTVWVFSGDGKLLINKNYKVSWH